MSKRRTLEEQIELAQEEIKKKETRIKELLQRQRSKADKDRTHRLCRRGGLVEKLLPGLAVITDEQFETFVERFLLSGDAEKAIEGMAAQIPAKPKNNTGTADNEAMLKPESVADSSQNGENKMPETVHSAAQPKTAQSGAPTGTVINSNSNGGNSGNNPMTNTKPANIPFNNGANSNRNGGNVGRQTS